LLTVSQAYSVAVFLWQYLIPVGVFAFCYGRIFHTIRRQSKVVSSHTGHSQNVAMATTLRDQNAGQMQQQATGTTSRFLLLLLIIIIQKSSLSWSQILHQSTGATTGNALSRTELNILKTMTTVIVLFLILWCVPAFTNLLQPLGVSTVNVGIIIILFHCST